MYRNMWSIIIHRTVLRVLCCYLTCTAALAARQSSSDDQTSQLTLRLQDIFYIFFQDSFQQAANEDVIMPWRSWLEKPNDISNSIRIALASPKWWKAWQELTTDIRGAVVDRLHPFLINNNGWSLHCSDAHKLCQADSNCALNYENFVFSCLSEQEVLSSWSETSHWNTNLNKSRQKREKTRSAVTKHLKHPVDNISAGRRVVRDRRSKSDRLISVSRGHKRRKHLNSKTNKKRTFQDLHYWAGKYWSNIYDRKLEAGKEPCSPDCLEALILLNKTAYGALLAQCDCQRSFDSHNETNNLDRKQMIDVCKARQATATVCRPRLYKPRSSVIGCTTARIRCENEPRCKAAQEEFLLRCSQVISGVVCTTGCMKSIFNLQMASIHFSSCVCDGVERPFCLKIRSHLHKLCRVEQDCSQDPTITRSQNNCSVSFSDAVSPPQGPRNAASTSHFSICSFLKYLYYFSVTLFIAYILT